MPTLTLPSVLAATIDWGPAWSIAVAILGIGFLIFVHELGHFLACRLTKTRVETFSIGFGARLFGWETFEGRRRFTVGRRRFSAAAGAMDVRIAAVPLGGYVKMAGEIGGDGSPGEGGERRAPKPDEFPGKSFGARLLIITAGVLMNAFAAVAFFTIALLIGLQEPTAIVGAVPPGGPAWQAGVETGDRLVSVDDVEVRSFAEFRNEVVYLGLGETVPLVVERDGKPLRLSVTTRYDEEDGTPEVQVGPGATWGVADARPSAFRVGPGERVLVAGRYAVGGAEAHGAAAQAHLAGAREATVVFLDRPGRPEFRVGLVDPQKKDRKIGVVRHEPMVVAEVRRGGPAEASGLRAGDEVLEADGAPVTSATALRALARLGRVKVRRAGAEAVVEVGREGAPEVAAWTRGIAWKEAASSLAVQPEPVAGAPSPAGEAGLLRGDRILKVGDREVASYESMIGRLRAQEGDTVRLQVATGDAPPREIVVTMRPIDAWRTALDDDLSVAREPVPVDGVVEAVALGGKRTVKEILNTFRVIRSLVARDVSASKNLGGPGTLVKFSSRSFAEGWATFLWFLAFISVNLCVLNILPIPVLDGGHLLFLIVEKIKGRPLTERAIARAQFVGFILLMALMVFAVTNDIRNL